MVGEKNEAVWTWDMSEDKGIKSTGQYLSALFKHLL